VPTGVATLYRPERAALVGDVPPIVEAFVGAAGSVGEVEHSKDRPPATDYKPGFRCTAPAGTGGGTATRFCCWGGRHVSGHFGYRPDTRNTAGSRSRGFARITTPPR